MPILVIVQVPQIQKQQPRLPYLGPDDATPDRLVGVGGCLDILAE